MSSSSSVSADASFPSGFSLLGGIPLKNPDLAASIIYAILFLLLTPLVAWRLAFKETRHAVFVRPVAVLLIRVATYIIRAVEADGNTSTGTLIAEQVLLLIGLIPLASTLVSLLSYHVQRNFVPTASEPKRAMPLSRILRVCELALIVAIVLAIVSASELNDAMSDAGTLKSLETYRNVTVGLTLGVTVLVPVLAAYETLREDLPVRPCLFILSTSVLLAIPSVYRLVVTARPPSLTSHGAKAAFYLLSALPEWGAVTALVGPNLDALFHVREGDWKRRVAKKMDDGEWTGPYVARDVFEMGEGTRPGEWRADGDKV